MKKEFIVERQGKAFVLYAGLLDLAHQNGLKSITTSLEQIPNETNYRTAICTATVVLEKEGVERVFTAIGDAAPNSVSPQMQTCLIRMAETRAKARALRDAVNVGVTALEEMDEDGAGDTGADRGYPGNPRRQAGPSRRSAASPVPTNTSADKCPSCHAPAGRPHASNCRA